MRIVKLARVIQIITIKRIKAVLLVLCIISVAGCATVPTVTPLPVPASPKGVEGKYHRMEKGQTLWKISKIYNVDIEDLIVLNHISDVTNIDSGQLIFIPKQSPVVHAFPVVKGNLEDFIWPIRGRVISGFGQIFNNRVNKGINISAPTNSNVVASRSGKVVFYSSKFLGFGKTIIIDHRDGFYTVYGCSKEVFIKPGDDVSQGMLIAKLGASGSTDKDSYLYFEIRKGHTPQNPNYYLN